MEIENLALKKFIKKNLRKGYIQLLQLLIGYPVLFIPKKNGKLRICINYKQLNSIIKKNQYLLLLILEIQDRIGNIKIFLKIDLKQAYHQIRIKEGDKQKTTFRLKEKLYKLLVIQFRLINIPATF